MLNLNQFVRYTELILYKTYADLKAETERTYLGFLWWIFEPIMYMFVFYLVFGVAMKHGTEDFVSFLLVGLTAWQWMKSCLSHGSDAILGSRVLMQQVHLPKVVFPTILILTDSTKFVFIFTLLLIYLWLSGYRIGWPYLALPAVLLVQLLFITAITYLLAAVIPFLPDLRFVVENVLQAIFFGSGIFFTVSNLPERYHFYFYLNPMANLIEDYRNILMYQQWPGWQGLLTIALVSLVGIRLGIYVIGRLEYVYPKITV